MSQKEFLSRLLKKLENAGIPFMVSGSLGSSFYGEPRATNDIDIVISSTDEQLSYFVESLGDDYYVSLDSAINALKNHSVFNIIDNLTGWKADLIICKDRPFSAEEFKRRVRAKILDVAVFVVSPEDQILSKLEWTKKSESERQFNDALGVAIVQLDNLDMGYLEKWAKELEVDDLLDKLLKIAEEGR